MAARKWIAKWDMGYAGTESEEPVDLVGDLGLDAKEVEEMSTDAARETVSNYAHEKAVENISAYGVEAD